METFDTFEAQALAEKRIDYDGVYAYQCVDLILQYAAVCYGVHGERGNAIDYWNNPSPVLLTKFTKIATQDVHRGDIVILNGLAGNPLGHIMVGTGNDGPTEFEGLEQNGQTGDGTGTGGDAIRTRYVQKVRIAGVLRPIVVAAPPAPAAPSAPTVQSTYNVAKPLPGYTNANNAANHLAQADTVAAGNYHIFNQAEGMINVTSNPGVAGSWINPNDNNVVVSSPTNIAAPVNAPNTADTFNVVVELPGYRTSGLAAAGGAAPVQVAVGTYFVFNRANNMVNVTKVPGQPGSWINPGNNVVAPPPAPPAPVAAPAAPVEPPAPAPQIATPPVAAIVDIPWQKTYRPFPKAVHYIATRDLTVKDLSGQAPDGPLQKYNPGVSDTVGVVSAYGTVTFEGVDYYRLKTNNDPKFKFWYCVAKIDPETHTPNLLVLPVNPLDPPSKVNVARDTLELAKARIEADMPKFLDMLPKWKKPKK
jgi:hypothetical protein